MIETTRRSYNERCKYWKKIDGIDLENLIHDNKPEGIFFARQIANTNVTDLPDNGIVDIDLQTVTIETQDDVSKLRPKDIVYYDNQLWIVNPPIDSQKYIKNTEYNKRANRIYRIILRNGGHE